MHEHAPATRGAPMIYPPAGLFLGIAYHLLIFALAGILAFKIASVRPNLAARDIERLARLDVWYGILLATAVAAGLSRALFIEGGWAIYARNAYFWGKLAAFVTVGILSIAPAIIIARWRRDIRKFATSVPCLEDVRKVQRILRLEAVGLAVVLVFAVALAAGYGFPAR
jgi:putative membrane protein